MGLPESHTSQSTRPLAVEEPVFVRHGEPIAIVGIGCRLPGQSNNSSSLWELLKNPVDLSCPFPPSRFNSEGFYHKDAAHHGTTNSRGSYFLNDDDIQKFDAQFFNISPQEAESMDPQVTRKSPCPPGHRIEKNEQKEKKKEERKAKLTTTKLFTAPIATGSSLRSLGRRRRSPRQGVRVRHGRVRRVDDGGLAGPPASGHGRRLAVSGHGRRQKSCQQPPVVLFQLARPQRDDRHGLFFFDGRRSPRRPGVAFRAGNHGGGRRHESSLGARHVCDDEQFQQ